MSEETPETAVEAAVEPVQEDTPNPGLALMGLAPPVASQPAVPPSPVPVTAMPDVQFSAGNSAILVALNEAKIEMMTELAKIWDHLQGQSM